MIIIVELIGVVNEICFVIVVGVQVGDGDEVIGVLCNVEVIGCVVVVDVVVVVDMVVGVVIVKGLWV